jgi:hypothetical protein
MKGLKALR